MVFPRTPGCWLNEAARLIVNAARDRLRSDYPGGCLRPPCRSEDRRARARVAAESASEMQARRLVMAGRWGEELIDSTAEMDRRRWLRKKKIDAQLLRCICAACMRLLDCLPLSRVISCSSTARVRIARP